MWLFGRVVKATDLKSVGETLRRFESCSSRFFDFFFLLSLLLQFGFVSENNYHMDKKALFDKIALSCVSYLESFEYCQLSEFRCGDGALTHELLLWDKRNVPFKLPRDMKNFYMIFNGISLAWDVNVGSRSIPVGEFQLNRLDSVQKVTMEGIFCTNDWKDVVIVQPDPKTCAAFLLQTISDVGDVYLVYRQPQSSSSTKSGSSSSGNNENEYIGLINQSGLYENPEVWFVDISMRWHFVCQSFTQYLRLLVSHLGMLFEWHRNMAVYFVCVVF